MSDMTDRLCAWEPCSRPLIQRSNEGPRDFERRMTCSCSCGARLGQWRAKQARESGITQRGQPVKAVVEFVPWPRVTGETDWQGAFAAHNIDPGDGGYFHRPRVPDTQSYTGSTAALLIRSAPS